MSSHVSSRCAIPRVVDFGAGNLAELQQRIRDPNWRIFAEEGTIYAFNNARFLHDPDPFVLFDQMGVSEPSHAFYLGYEMMKAKTALTLHKSYRQDQALEWGFLTEPETSRRERRGGFALPRSDEPETDAESREMRETRDEART